MDQQFAMQWVQQNIAAFGGNPRNVTVFGESAGGESMFSNLVSPLASGLFRRMIIESGSYAQTLPALSVAESEGMSFSSAAGCSDQTAACLRALSVQAILNNQSVIAGIGGLTLTPNVDGHVLPESIDTALAGGDFNHVPVIDGTNHDEFRLFVALLFDLGIGPMTADQYAPVLDYYFGSNGPAVLSEYPPANYPSPDLAFATVITDNTFSCPALDADDSMAKFTRVRAYEFADENAPALLPPVSFPYGAYHGAELQYLFGATPPDAFTPEQVELSGNMINAWTRFAKNGNPGGGWKPLSRSGDGFFESLVPPSPQREAVSAFSADHNCSFWQSLPSN
ncbi:MAG: carboxylesterase family protein, partial [Candidatus Binataceae bacterium]